MHTNSKSPTVESTPPKMIDFKCLCKGKKHDFANNKFLTKIFILDGGMEKCRLNYYQAIGEVYPGAVRCICYDKGLRCPFYSLFMADPKVSRSKMLEAYKRCQSVYFSSIQTTGQRFMTENEEFLLEHQKDQLLVGKWRRFTNIFGKQKK